MRELAYLNSGIKINLIDDNTKETKEHYYEGGLSEFVQHLGKKIRSSSELTGLVETELVEKIV